MMMMMMDCGRVRKGFNVIVGMERYLKRELKGMSEIGLS